MGGFGRTGYFRVVAGGQKESSSYRFRRATRRIVDALPESRRSLCGDIVSAVGVDRIRKELLMSRLTRGWSLWMFACLSSGELSAQESGAWVELGGSASGGGISGRINLTSSPCLLLDPLGSPVVAYSYYDASESGIALKQWDGASWMDHPSALPGTWIRNLFPAGSNSWTDFSIALDPSGNPVIAWSGPWIRPDGVQARDVFLVRWNGASWVGLGGSASNGGVSNTGAFAGSPSVAWDQQGMPILAWNEGWILPNWMVKIKRWNGFAWTDMGGSGSSGGIPAIQGWADSPSLKVDSAKR